MQADWSAVPREMLEAVYRAWGELAQASSPSRTGNVEAKRCGFGSSEIAVSPSGTLYPCARLVVVDQRQSIQCGHVTLGIDRDKLGHVRYFADLGRSAIS